MAVPTTQWFNYEVTFSVDQEGMPNGMVVNRQHEQGATPGLAGLNPTVTLLGDSLLVESNPREAPPHPAWDWITAFIPFAHDAYVTRLLRAAQVRSFEIELPGLAQRFKPGCRMKLTQVYAPLPEHIFSSRRLCEVILLIGGEEVHRWSSPTLSIVAW